MNYNIKTIPADPANAKSEPESDLHPCNSNQAD